MFLCYQRSGVGGGGGGNKNTQINKINRTIKELKFIIAQLIYKTLNLIDSNKSDIIENQYIQYQYPMY